EKFWLDTPGDELGKLRRFGVGAGRFPRIAQHPRQILEVLLLAVPVEQAREYPEDLDVPLQSHQIEPADEFRLACTQEGKSPGQQPLTIPQRPVSHPGRGPCDVAIL